MRRAVVLVSVLCACLAGLLVAPTSAPTYAADPGPGFAAERLARGHYPGEGPPRSTGERRVQLTEHGVFHIIGQGVWSHRFGGSPGWTRANATWDTFATTASGAGDYLMGVSFHLHDSELQMRVQTIALEGTEEATELQLVQQVDRDQSTRLTTAAAGDHAYILVAEGGIVGRDPAALGLTLYSSDDRGATWSDPVDVLAATGLPATGTRPTVSLEAEGDVLALVAGPRVIVSRDHAATWSAPAVVTAPEVSSGQPVAATDGSTVRVAWLQDDAGTPALHSALVSADGTLTDAGTVPTAPSTLPSGLATEVFLSRLGATYAVQVVGGRLVSLDPDGAWRWPLPAEPTDITTDCAPGCPILMPAAIYGDRLVHRGLGSSSYWFVPRTSPRLTVVEGAGAVLRPSRRVVVTVEDDDGTLFEARCSGTTHRVLANGPSCYAEMSRGNRRQSVTATVTDTAGNTTSLTHRWTTDGIAPRVRLTPRAPELSVGEPVRWSWRPTDANGVRRVLPTITRTPLAGRQTRRALPGSSSTVARRPRAGETVCVEVEARDVVDNRSTELSCAAGMLPEQRLGDVGGTLSGARYSGGTARLLPPGRPVGSSSSRLRTADLWAFRVLACPTCGSLRVVTEGRVDTFGLRSPRTGFRTVVVDRRRSAYGVELDELVATGRVVLDGYWAIDRLPISTD